MIRKILFFVVLLQIGCSNTPKKDCYFLCADGKEIPECAWVCRDKEKEKRYH